jgi:4-amino-4-deoxy-L-arabinose transferase-like glycosyltransferase
MRKPSLSDPGTGILVALSIGVLLRAFQYASFGSLWSDELSIALNVTQKGWWDLLSEPLLYQQVAPIGFLAAEKLGVAILGASEWGLRLYPFLASLLALFLFWRVSARYLDGFYQVGAILLFALSPALLWYTRNAKQYAGDVAVALLLLLLALRSLERSRRAGTGLRPGILGGAAILCSQPSVLSAPVMAGVSFVQRWRSGEKTADVGWMAACWCLAASVGALTSAVLASKEAESFMHSAWQFRFFPIPWDSWDDVWWLPNRFVDFYAFLIGLFRPDTVPEMFASYGYLALSILGFDYLRRRNRFRLLLLLVSPAMAIFVSVVRVLPLSGRVSLHMAPSLILLSMAGVRRMRDWLPTKLRPSLGYVALIAGLAPGLAIPLRLPLLNQRQPSRQILATVRSQWQPGDVMYVENSGVKAIRFYGNKLGIGAWMEGERHNHDVREVLREVDRLRELDRVWFFLSGTPTCTRRGIEAYLEVVGAPAWKVEDPFGNEGRSEATAYLVEFDHDSRLSLDADAFQIPECQPGSP